MRKPTKKLKSYRFVPSFERLEDRFACAGLINVTVPGGVLNLNTVAGQDQDEIVTVARQANGDYLLTPGAAVTLRIGGVDFTTPQAVSGVTAGLNAKLGIGNDQLTLDNGSFPKSVTVDLGDGNNTFTMTNGAIGGALKVTAKGGIDTINFGAGVNTNVGVGVNFTASLGDGTNVVQTNLTHASFGSVPRIDGGIGNDSFLVTGTDPFFDFTTLVGGLIFNGGAGAGLNTVSLGNGTSRLAFAGPVTLNSPGAANINLGGASFDAAALNCRLGNGVNVLTGDVLDFHVVGSFNWTSGTADDTINFAANTNTIRVGTTLSISTGDGISNITVEPDDLLFVGGSLTVKSGNTPTVSTQRVNSEGNTVIGGSANLTSGIGETSLRLSGNRRLTVGGNIQLTHGVGLGDTFVGSNSTLLVPGNINIKRASGQGINQVFAGTGGDSAIGKSVTMTGGAQQRITMAGVIGGGVTFTGTPGAAAAMFLASNGARTLQVNGAIKLTSTAAATVPGVIQIVGLIAEGAVTISSGAGNETLSIDNSAFLKAFTTNLGAGVDLVNLELQGLVPGSQFVGITLFNGGAGTDTFNIGGNSAATQAVVFRNTVTVDGGLDVDAITLGTQLTFDPLKPLVQKNIP